jgi:hypothetical protein
MCDLTGQRLRVSLCRQRFQVSRRARLTLCAHREAAHHRTSQLK